MKIEPNNIYCMDCLEGMRMMDDESVDLIVTDPPYDVDYGKKANMIEHIRKRNKTFFHINKDLIKRNNQWKDSSINYTILAR